MEDSWMNNMEFSRISVDDGLNNSIVYQIIQDKDGILWFGLHDGIDKYNGYDFIHYDLNDVTPEKKRGHHPVTSIYKKNEREFWLGSGRSLYYYNIAKDDFEIGLDELSSDEPVNQINNLLFLNDSICMIGSTSGVFRYNILSCSTRIVEGLPLNILSLFQYQGNIWAGTVEGIRIIDPETLTQKNIYTGQTQEILNRLDAFSYLYDREKRVLLIGTRTQGLYLLDESTSTIRELTAGGERFPHIRVIRKYRGDYLIGTDGAGLMILGPSMELLAQYRHNEDNERSLSSNGIYDILIDRQERLWIITYGGGINVYDPNLKPFRIIEHIPHNPNSLKNNNSRSIIQVNNEIWFGTVNGISILDPDGNWRFVLSGGERDKANIILSLCEDKEGRIWAGTFSNGIYLLDRTGNILRHLRKEDPQGIQLSTNYVYRIYQDRQGNIWIGGIRGGLLRYQADQGGSQVFNSIQNVNAILETRAGDILVGTLDGLYRLSPGKDGNYALRPFQGNLGKLDARIYAIAEIDPGIFWLGTEGSGLLRIDPGKDEVLGLTTNKGLPSNIVYGILEASDGSLWLSTTSGLSCVDPDSLTIRNYSIDDGLSGKDFNYGAYYQTQEGIMYFGGTQGITYFDPSSIQPNRVIPNIVFTGISVYGKNATDPSNPFQGKNINETGAIVLKHNQSSFIIGFAAINYTSPQKNQYSWKLEEKGSGIEPWSPVSNERYATFTYLPPGNYTFQVRASNNDGIWNEEGRSLNIVVLHSFWSSMIARILYVLIAILLFIALQRYIIIYLREKQASEKIRFFINIAHDIRTPLTLIRAPINKLAQSEGLNKKEKEEVQLVQSNSERLSNLVNQLLDFQKATLNKAPLKVGQNNITELVEEVMHNFQPLLDSKRISLQIKNKSCSDTLWFDRQKVEKILYNLLSNAIKYSFEGGGIFIILEESGGQLKVSVIDNGRGIPARQQREIFNRYFRAQNAVNSKETGSGVGLMLTKKLVELHKGVIGFKSAENQGSVFSFSVPCRKENYEEQEFFSAEDEQVREPAELPEGQEFHTSDSYTLLLVEDNPELQAYLKSELQGMYNITTARNGAEALKITASMDVDLIVSDVMMPEMDGWELCRNIRNNLATGHIPIILLTSLSSEEYYVEGLEYGADDFIEKPFDIVHLKARISNLLRSRESLRSKFMRSTDMIQEIEIPSKPDKKLMTDLQKIVSEGITQEHFGVEELCRQLGVSRPVLYRKLKAYTGHSPQDYISLNRLNRAAYLIRTGSMSIKEVAYEAGFSDPKYFSKSFKKHFGVRPSEYLSRECE